MASARQGWQLGKRIAPPRFVAFGMILAAGLAVAWPMLGFTLGSMIAFDVAAAVFLISVAGLMREADIDSMQRAAEENDANRTLLLGLTAITMLIILVSIADELHGKISSAQIFLVVATLVFAWLFSNTVYALHYAHVFYLNDEAGNDQAGLEFPRCDRPDYWDFLYFSFTLGMTFQTSDVDITTRRMRRIVTGHCLAAFVFNLGVIAFTINVLGGS